MAQCNCMWCTIAGPVTHGPPSYSCMDFRNSGQHGVTLRALADRFRIIAPDQRGFNLSDAPADPKCIAAITWSATCLRFPIICLPVIPRQDQNPSYWRGMTGAPRLPNAAAISQPSRISKLIIANGVHPVCFQEALIMMKPNARPASISMS